MPYGLARARLGSFSLALALTREKALRELGMGHAFPSRPWYSPTQGVGPRNHEVQEMCCQHGDGSWKVKGSVLRPVQSKGDHLSAAWAVQGYTSELEYIYVCPGLCVMSNPSGTIIVQVKTDWIPGTRSRQKIKEG